MALRLKRIAKQALSGAQITGRAGTVYTDRSTSRGGVLAAAALVGALLCVPPTYGLGLGDIDVSSALNQPLAAEITLLSVKPDEVGKINVRLADDIAYLTSGVDRAPLLNQLLFDVSQAGGKTVIRVTTREAIKEPFLDFIIEVNWPTGRLLREYTLLLDPPTFAGESAAAIAAPTTAPSVDERAAPPALQPSAPAEAPAAPARGRAPEVAPAREVPDIPPRPGFSVAAGGAEFGPVQAHETLLGIAKKVKPSDGYSDEQVMLAMFRLNPEAFAKDNINNLKMGYVLRVPDEAEIEKLSRTAASREAREHYRRWLDARRTKAAAGGQQVGSQAGLAGVADAADGGQAAGKASDASARLRLLSPEEGGGAGIGGTGPGGAGEVDAAEVEKLAQSEQTTDVANLKDRIASLERLITLKDDMLTELQRQLADGETPMIAVPGTEGAEPATTPESAVAVEQPPAQTGTEPAASVEPAAPQAAPTKAKPEKAKPAPQPADESFVDVLLQPSLLALIVGVVLLVGAVVWVIVRRRQQAYEDFELPMADAEGGLELPSTDELTKRSAPAAVPTGAAALADDAFPAEQDFAAANIEALETDESEIDPIAEADVYLAYRRFQQAEELIREALRKEPERQDLQLKMLEIYFGSGNKEAFEAQAEALYAMLGGEESEVWERVREMGQELCPDHPLFGGAGRATQAFDHASYGAASAGVAAAGAAAGMTGQQVAAEQDFAPLWEQPGATDGGFDAGAGASTSTALDSPDFSPLTDHFPTDLSADTQALDFESGLAGGASVTRGGRADSAPAEADSTAQNDAGGLDFDLSGFNVPRASAAGGTGSPADAGGALDFGFNELAPETATLDAAPADARRRSEDDLEAALRGFTAPQQPGGEVEEVFTGLDDELGADGEDLFAGSDMVGTKLDLARAYIDMDDHDGARGILQEVIKEGTELQIQEAQELMKKIG